MPNGTTSSSNCAILSSVKLGHRQAYGTFERRAVPIKFSWGSGVGFTFAYRNGRGRLHMGVVGKFLCAYKMKLRRCGKKHYSRTHS